MDNLKNLAVNVTLKGGNYLFWSRTVKTILSGQGLWAHVEEEAPKRLVRFVDKGKEDEGSGAIVAADEEQAKWYQYDKIALVIIQSSLDPAIHEAYSYCESAKQLWETLKKVYGNLSNISHVFEVKKSINALCQEDMEFTQFFGKYRSLWAELEMLRPPTADLEVIAERIEQDKVFGLLLKLNSSYNDLVCHLLRADKLPCLEEACGAIQREQGSHSLLGGKRELVETHKSFCKYGDKKLFVCEYCKRKGHTKDRCWTLHPHLKPEASKGTAMVATCGDFVRKADLKEVIKSLNALKESSTSYYSSNSEHIIVDSGASHNMIKNPRLISNMKPALGNVVIADGKKVPIRGVGDLRLFDKSSKALYVPTFTSNLLSVNRTVCDLNYRAIFEPDSVCFQDIKSGKILGEGC